MRHSIRGSCAVGIIIGLSFTAGPAAAGGMMGGGMMGQDATVRPRRAKTHLIPLYGTCWGM